MEEQRTVRTGDLTEGRLWKKLWSYFVPVVLGLLFQQFYNTVDAVIVGRFAGTVALAAVGGSSARIVNLVINFFIGLTGGASVIISQRYGANDDERLQRTEQSIVLFGLIVGAVLTVVMYIASPWALRLIGTPEDTMADSVSYLRIYFMGSIPLMLYNIGSSVLLAVGDSRRPLLFLAASCLTNIILDLLFVRVFRMGAAGAAIATALSCTLSAVLTVRALVREKGPCRLSLRGMRMDAASLKEALCIGIPAGIQSMMYTFSNVLIQKAVNGLGTLFVAAWAATDKVDGIYGVITNALGRTVCAFTGQCFGAAKYKRMKEGVRGALIASETIAIVFSLLLFFFGRYGLMIISADAAVVETGTAIMQRYVLFYFAWAFIEVISATLRGAGDVKWPTVITVLGTCGIRVLWVLLVIPRYHTMEGVTDIYAVSWMITAAAFMLYYLRSGWLERVRPKRREENARG